MSMGPCFDSSDESYDGDFFQLFQDEGQQSPPPGSQVPLCPVEKKGPWHRAISQITSGAAHDRTLEFYQAFRDKVSQLLASSPEGSASSNSIHVSQDERLHTRQGTEWAQKREMSRVKHSLCLQLVDTERGNRGAGFFNFTIEVWTRTKRPPVQVSYLAEIGVEDEYQGRGLARLILQAYQDFLVENSVDFSYLHVVSRKAFTASWYQKQGYQLTSESLETLEQREGGVEGFFMDSSGSPSIIPHIEMVKGIPSEQDQNPREGPVKVESIERLRKDYFSNTSKIPSSISLAEVGQELIWTSVDPT